MGGVWDSLLHILYLSRRGICPGAPSDCGLFPLKGFPLAWLGHLPISTLGKASIWHIQFFYMPVNTYEEGEQPAAGVNIFSRVTTTFYFLEGRVWHICFIGPVQTRDLFGQG